MKSKHSLAIRNISKLDQSIKKEKIWPEHFKQYERVTYQGEGYEETLNDPYRYFDSKRIQTEIK